MAERIRWKQKHDALALELEVTRAELGQREASLVAANSRIEELEQELRGTNDRVQRAKLEGLEVATRGFRMLMEKDT